MNEDKIKMTLLYYSKGKNARVEIALNEYLDKKDAPFIIVATKRLTSFEERIITVSQTAYSIETFIVLKDLFTHFIDHPDFKKKTNPWQKFDRWGTEITTTY